MYFMYTKLLQSSDVTPTSLCLPGNVLLLCTPDVAALNITCFPGHILLLPTPDSVAFNMTPWFTEANNSILPYSLAVHVCYDNEYLGELAYSLIINLRVR